ncbi:HD family hydrolase [Kosakonia sacchari]|uniref:HD family hydrolase n=1 Tax=Kosakonia sacchari TaxID=1158459 RepID=UPI0030BE8810
MKQTFIQTYTGKKFDYLAATAGDIDIKDIANALSNICRFAGHLPEFYSVAQHSVLCSQLVPVEYAFEDLMHDAAEAYVQDIPAPLKSLLPDYRRMETMVDDLIRNKFGLPLEHSQVVKYADLTMLATERRDLEIDDGTHWTVLEGIPASDLIQVNPLRPGQAFGLFMNRFNELQEIRKCA